MSLGAKSFVSFDEPDGLGIRAQVMVTVGSLPIKNVNSNSGVARVEFDHKAAENLSFAISANVLESAPFYQALVDAAGTGQPVSFRLETQRKNAIDRRFAFPPKEERDRVEGVTYLTTQGGQEVVKKLVMVNGISNEEMRTDPAQDDKWANVPRSQVPAFIDVANSPEMAGGGSAQFPDVSATLREMADRGGFSPAVAGTVGALAIAGGMSPVEVETLVDKAARAAAPTAGVTRGGIKESQPWYEANFGGERNLGSYEVGAATSILGWAEKYLAGALAAYAEQNPGSRQIDPSPTAAGRIDQAKSLAAGILLVADAVQVAVYGRDVRADRFVNSHSKARGVVFHVIDDVMPYSFAEAVFEGKRQEWFDTVLALSVERFAAAIEVLDEAAILLDGLGVVIGGTAVTAPSAAKPADPVIETATESVNVTADPQAVEEPTSDEHLEPVEDRLSAVMSEFDATPSLPFLAEDLGPLDANEMDGISPAEADIAAFGKLAGFAGISNDEATAWLHRTFHVDSVNDLHGPRLAALLAYYRGFAPEAAKQQFVNDVRLGEAA